MAPYRSREEPRAPRDAPRTGLVADMVRQFADAFAFVRELVQNGIDAGASAIEVTVDREGGALTAVRVADDGCGMTLKVIEDVLLVLFRSTKDEDAGKIGKYGVGFMSVLAIDPSEVVIDTWRDGHAYRVRLFPDHSYEIEHGAPRAGHGTSVAVLKAVADEAFEGFWQDVTSSLHRWCRHAELAIHFTLIGGGASDPRRARADVPFDVRAAVQVRERYHDGMEIVLGPIAGSGALPPSGSGEDAPAPFAGFYNRGLTLHETTAPLRDELSHVRFKVKSAELCHTLSRDDVRRDHAFHLALSRASALCDGPLRGAVLRELAAETEKVAADQDAPRLAELFEIAAAPPISAGLRDLPLPLAHAIEGQRIMRVWDMLARCAAHLKRERHAILCTHYRTDLTATLAAQGIPVALIRRTVMVQAVERADGGAIGTADVKDECVAAREIQAGERLPGDEALCAALGEALSYTGVNRVALGTFLGTVQEGRGALGVLVLDPKPGATTHVLPVESATLAKARWRRGALLVLNAAAEAVDCARRATSPAIGAHLLARYVLLSGPGLSSRASEALAVRALEQIG